MLIEIFDYDPHSLLSAHSIWLTETMICRKNFPYPNQAKSNAGALPLPNLGRLVLDQVSARREHIASGRIVCLGQHWRRKANHDQDQQRSSPHCIAPTASMDGLFR
jgi:hypothetical protein